MGAGDSALAAFQSSIAILIIIGSGYMARRHNLLDTKGESQISYLCNNLFLPLLLVSEVGSNLDSGTVLEMWPLLAFAVAEMVLAYLLGEAARKWLKFPLWITPALIFNNTTSLPLLLARNLKESGAMADLLMGDGDDESSALKRCESYILVSAVVHTIARFSIGPRLMARGEDDEKDAGQDERHNGHDHRNGNDSDGNSDGQQSDDYDSDEERSGEHSALLRRRRDARQSPWKARLRVFLRKTAYFRSFFNPALTGGLVAVVIGLVPFTHTAFFEDDGVFKKNLQQALKQLGDLIPALLPFAVGSKLFSKPSPPERAKSLTNVFALLFLLFVRFALIPGLCVGAVHLARNVSSKTAWKSDPALDFAIMISGAGPPAITLMSVTEIAGASEAMIGQVARVLAVSYTLTPLLCGTVVAAIAVIRATTYA